MMFSSADCRVYGICTYCRMYGGDARRRTRERLLTDFHVLQMQVQPHWPTQLELGRVGNPVTHAGPSRRQPAR